MRWNRTTSGGRRVGAAVGLAVLVGIVVSSLASAPAGAASSCSDSEATQFVCRGFASFARREATPAEIDEWAPQVPARRTSFIATLARGAEGRHQTVLAYYGRYSETEPTPADHGYWDAETTTSTGLRRLQAALLANGATTDAGLVDRSYELLLGRTPGPEERSYWVGRIGLIGRNRVAADIAFTLEARRAAVVAAFRNELLRVPDAQSRDYWTERLRTGTSYLDLRIGLRSSPDGYRRSGDACASPAPQTTVTCPAPA